MVRSDQCRLCKLIIHRINTVVGIAVKRTYLCIGFSTGLYATSYIEEQIDSLVTLEVRLVGGVNAFSDLCQAKVMKHLRTYAGKKDKKILAAGVTADERIVRYCSQPLTTH